MQAVTMEITIPKALLSSGLRTEQAQKEIEKWLVISLFREGRISSGKAGSLLGVGRRGFLSFWIGKGLPTSTTRTTN